MGYTQLTQALHRGPPARLWGQTAAMENGLAGRSSEGKQLPSDPATPLQVCLRNKAGVHTDLHECSRSAVPHSSRKLETTQRLGERSSHKGPHRSVQDEIKAR